MLDILIIFPANFFSNDFFFLYFERKIAKNFLYGNEVKPMTESR